MSELIKKDLKTDKRPYNFKKRSCPLSGAGAPKVDYKNINLLKKNDPLYYGIIDGNMIKIQNYFSILY